MAKGVTSDAHDEASTWMARRSSGKGVDMRLTCVDDADLHRGVRARQEHGIARAMAGVSRAESHTIAQSTLVGFNRCQTSHTQSGTIIWATALGIERLKNMPKST